MSAAVFLFFKNISAMCRVQQHGLYGFFPSAWRHVCTHKASSGTVLAGVHCRAHCLPGGSIIATFFIFV